MTSIYNYTGYPKCIIPVQLLIDVIRNIINVPKNKSTIFQYYDLNMGFPNLFLGVHRGQSIFAYILANWDLGVENNNNMDFLKLKSVMVQ